MFGVLSPQGHRVTFCSLISHSANIYEAPQGTGPRHGGLTVFAVMGLHSRGVRQTLTRRRASHEKVVSVTEAGWLATWVVWPGKASLRSH